jgi:hypothetical protein
MTRARNARKKDGEGFDLAVSIGFGVLVAAGCALSGLLFAPAAVASIISITAAAVSGAAPLIAFIAILGVLVPIAASAAALAWRLRR